ncbi:MAG: tetratricopeptide repeat protein [Actinomycetota bacterium]|nr:tetratricopeptide repeat protein [Actinomycetota bacterium]MDD5667804.1 tetratricopeptide repeat protein [Actinomycetota bacterium]
MTAETGKVNMRVALFQFATDAVGRVPAMFENMLALYIMNGLERAAGFQVIDLTTPVRGGEILSLTGILGEDEVREASRRAGAGVSLWGDLRFRPGEQSLISGLELALKVMAEDDGGAHEKRLRFDALRGDTRSGTLEVDIAALEDLVEEVLVTMADLLGLDLDMMHMERIGEGLSHSDRAVGYFVYALRIAVEKETKLRLYLKAIAADPGFAMAYTNAAQLLLGEARYGEAMRLLLRAEARFKQGGMEPDILNLLGVATMNMGMWEEAVRVWEMALAISPSHVETMCNLAAAYAMREMPDRAEEYYHGVLSIREDYPLAWFSLGRLQARAEKYEEAEGSMRRYIELCPGDPWAYYILGASLLHQGKEAEAEFALAKATQLDPDGEAGTLARREMQELKG